ncbi:Putative ribonuclease H protein At1g65750, partial [Linum grandiflorum]
VEAITALPACSSTGTDRFIWQFSKNGDYTVKSAYRAYLDKLVDRSTYAQPGEWRKLWNLQVPLKMAHFIWRIAHCVLPTRGRLRQRGVDVTGSCGLCGKEYETDWHLFLECEWTQKYGKKRVGQIVYNRRMIPPWSSQMSSSKR